MVGNSDSRQWVSISTVSVKTCLLKLARPKAIYIPKAEVAAK